MGICFLSSENYLSRLLLCPALLQKACGVRYHSSVIVFMCWSAYMRIYDAVYNRILHTKRNVKNSPLSQLAGPQQVLLLC